MYQLNIVCLFLLLNVAAVAAVFPEIYDFDSPKVVELKKGLQKVNIPKVFGKHVSEKPVKTSRLLHRLPAKTPKADCPPYWTGSSCENPICKETVFLDTDTPSAQNTYIDMFYAASSSDSFYIYVDNTMHGQELQLMSDSGLINPSLTLFDDNGKAYTPTSVTASSTFSYYTFQFLPSQRYKVQVNSKDPNGAMLVLFTAYTYMTTMIGGIPYNSTDDSAFHNDTPSYSFYTNTSNLFVATSIGLQYPGTIKTVSFWDESLISNQPMKLRYGCFYEYFTDGLRCEKEGHFYAKIQGVDFYGSPFVRLHSFVCEAPQHD